MPHPAFRPALGTANCQERLRPGDGLSLPCPPASARPQTVVKRPHTEGNATADYARSPVSFSRRDDFRRRPNADPLTTDNASVTLVNSRGRPGRGHPGKR